MRCQVLGGGERGVSTRGPEEGIERGASGGGWAAGVNAQALNTQAPRL